MLRTMMIVTTSTGSRNRRRRRCQMNLGTLDDILVRPSRRDMVRTPAAEAVGSGRNVDNINVDDDSVEEEEEKSWRHCRPVGKGNDDDVSSAFLSFEFTSRFAVERDIFRAL